MEKIIIANTILLCAILVSLLVGVIVKYRTKIIRFNKKKQVVRFIVTVLIPFAVPLILSAVDFRGDENTVKFRNMPGPVAILLVIATANLVVQLIMWVKEKKESDQRLENEAASYAFNSLFEIHRSKNSQLRNAHHDGLKRGMLTDADIPYNIFDQIRKITWEFGNTVSRITGIPTMNFDSAFIYRYTYPKAGEKDRKWRWVTGKGSKLGTSLNDFAEMTDSTFHYMGHNNVSTLFYNDKAEAHKAQRYLYSDKDYSHDCIGSIVAAKVAFSGNDHSLCEGIVMVNSYGHRFLDNLPECTEDELAKLILENTLPCFRNLLTTELAMLYFHHRDEPSDGEDTHKNKPITTSPPSSFREKLKMSKMRFKCIVEANKKIWTRK